MAVSFQSGGFQLGRQMRCIRSCLLCVVSLVLSGRVVAEGLVHQLPDDGGWVSFKLSGKGIGPDGALAVTIEGTQTVRSVGRTTVDDKPCRWIELDSQFKVQRQGRPAAELNEIIKVLVPETYLVKGQNPRDHVLKAYRGTSSGMAKELDLKGQGAREIQSLDEVFHAPLKYVTELPASEVKTEKRTWKCEGFTGKSEADNAGFTTETRTNKDAPFGVITYRYEKGRMAQGMRTMEWQLVDFGGDAVSAFPNAR